MAIVFEIPLFFGPPCTYKDKEVRQKEEIFAYFPEAGALHVLDISII